jgi:cytoskeletal protein CcmA (bactofilin family)
MIGKGISISGDVSADSNLKVEGVVEGRSVQTAHDVEIGDTAKVTANISAKVVRIAGEVNGDIAGSERVVIARSGRVQGNIVAPRVQLEDGALFRGSIDMNPAPAADARPSSARPTAVDPGAKSSAVASAAASAAGQATEAATGGARKEPGLTFKSG